MRYILYILLPILITLFSSCGTIHEYPDDLDEEITLETDLSVSFVFDNGDLDEHIYNPTLRVSPFEWRSNKKVRYTIEVYKKEDILNAAPLAKQTVYAEAITDDEIVANFKLPIDEYNVLAWVDYILLDNNNDLFYTPNLLTNIALLNSTGSDKSKEVFSGKKHINLKDELQQKEIVVDMYRPAGKFRIVATDYTDHQSVGRKKPSYVTYTYHNSIYRNFNVYNDAPYNLIENQLLDANITDFSNNECVIALDWVLAKIDGTTVEVSFDIYDDEGVLINEVPPIQFPIKRDMLTIIKGNFLTHSFRGDGGIGIDDEFEEEIEIIMPND